jgi:hypothetical protein
VNDQDVAAGAWLLRSALGRAGEAADPRTADAVDHLWWSVPGIKSGPPDVVDWGRSRPNEMITFNALRALGSAGALD